MCVGTHLRALLNPQRKRKYSEGRSFILALSIQFTQVLCKQAVKLMTYLLVCFISPILSGILKFSGQKCPGQLHSLTNLHKPQTWHWLSLCISSLHLVTHTVLQTYKVKFFALYVCSCLFLLTTGAGRSKLDTHVQTPLLIMQMP